MPEITDPQAIKFCNEQIRPIADRFMQLYWAGKSAAADFTADDLAGLFPNDDSIVVDGSAQDGRTPITGADVNIMLSHINAYAADMEATSNLKRNQIDKVAVNPLP